jgi:hypothetical protein
MKHVIALIHGISDEDNPDVFTPFWNSLSKEYSRLYNACLDDFFMKAPISWDVATNTGEKAIFESCFDKTRASDKYLVHGDFFETSKALGDTRAWKYFATYLAGDIIAYVDEADNQIRETVWKELVKNIVRDDNSIAPYSLIGHSLGSVIAFDFIYSLFQRNCFYSFANQPKSNQAQLDSWKASFRNLYTIGSPVGLFMMRNRNLWANDFAALTNPVENSENIIRTWLNIWDKDDLVAFPLERIFKNQSNNSLKDIEVDTGMIMPWAHTNYWHNQATIRSIAKTLPPPQSFNSQWKHPPATDNNMTNG